jgi:hypothetical protein
MTGTTPAHRRPVHSRRQCLSLMRVRPAGQTARDYLLP